MNDDLRKVITDMREAAATEDVADEWLSIDYWADRLEGIADDIEPRLLPRSPSEHVDSLVSESRAELDARSARVAELMGTTDWALADPIKPDGEEDLPPGLVRPSPEQRTALSEAFEEEEADEQ